MSNFIHDIEITNFKSIRHQKIEGCKRINVFIGYPNVGKSNILEALAMLAYATSTAIPVFADLCRIQQSTDLFFDGNISESILIQYSDDKRIRISFEDNERLGLLSEVYLAHAAEEIAWNIAKRFLVGKQTATEISLDKIEQVMVNGENSLPQTVKKYEFRSGIYRRETQQGTLNFPLGENLFFTIETNAQLRKETAGLFTPYGLKLLFEKGDDYNLAILKFLNDEVFFKIPFYQIADTLQRLIFYKSAIRTNKDSVLLFEEPEAHMFPPYISKLTGDIWYDQSNQYFLTTHSPFVLNDFLENAREELALYAVGYQNGETTIKRLTEDEVHEAYQYGLDLFLNLESYTA